MTSDLETLVCLHGAVGNTSDWEGLRLAVESWAQCEALCLWDTEPGDLIRWSKWLSSEYGGEDRILVGYSLGGRLALHSLVHAETAWRAAVIISGHTGMDSDDERHARLITDDLWAKRLEALPPEEFNAMWQRQPVLQSSLPVSIDPHPEMTRSFREWSLGNQEDLLNSLSKLKIPTLWVTGEHDPKFGIIAQRAAYSMFDAAHVVISDAGHRVHMDQPEATADAILTFVQSLEA